MRTLLNAVLLRDPVEFLGVPPPKFEIPSSGGELRTRELGEFRTNEDERLSDVPRLIELDRVNTGCDILQLGIKDWEAFGV
jgi:hypothetical protein